MLIILGISILYVYVLSLFPPIQYGNSYNSLLVVLQLFSVSTIVYFLDQVLQYYGVCGAYAIFLASNGCKVIFWQAFSLKTVNAGRGPEFEGSVICIFHLLSTWADKTRAIHESIFRKSHPNLITLGSTIFIFTASIYLQGITPSKIQY
jgi:protein transport protein SEC61 subunit alpha